ncbi:MAG: cob(I)yrinic acid a,c-diamide adenosyltransferase [Promethearchaeota archaeon]|nr:MAG: cob(I)yrinic acid a,c-diamide adenosyltransferase [Candidatus Lokiarchaeota archaeon]
MDKPIYTKKGDDGETTLLSGEKVDKANERVNAYGTLDELNASLGVAKVYSSEFIQEKLQKIQEKVFFITSELASKNSKKVIKPTTGQDTKNLEALIDEISKKIPPSKHFIIPGGSPSAAFLHLSRTICRRAERIIIRLSKQEKINSEIVKYLNRLSDLLFILARYANLKEGKGDQLISRKGISWQKLE